MDYLEELFRHWEENGTDSEELHHALTEIYPETCEKEQEVLLRCVSAERRNAFKAGFDCAVQLLKMGKEQEYPGEEWRKIEGYENYSVSSYGRVRNDKRKKIKKAIITPAGYLRIQLTDNNGCSKAFFVHRLVAQAFIPEVDGKRYVNHINENKQDNRFGNLEWVTHKENTRHYINLHTEERKKHMGKITMIAAEKSSKPVLLYKNGIYVRRFPSIRQACKFVGTDYSTFKKYLIEKKIHPSSYEFRFEEK